MRPLSTTTGNQTGDDCPHRGYLRGVVTGLIDRFIYRYGTGAREVTHARLCRPAILLRQFVRYGVAGFDEYLDRQASILSRYLHEPHTESLRLARDHAVHLQLSEYRRGAREHGKVATSPSLCWPEKSAYRKLIMRDTRSRVVAGYHFGDYSGGLHCLLNEGENRRQRIVLRDRVPVQTFTSQQQTKAVTTLSGRQFSPLTTAGLLRRGNTTLTIFCDLPRYYGTSVEVEFLGRRARFPRGPAQIAVFAGAPILPVICFRTGEGHQLDLHPLIETGVRRGEAPSDTVKRLTQQLVKILERYLYAWPAQWRFLNHLPFYFVDEREQRPMSPEVPEAKVEAQDG